MNAFPAWANYSLEKKIALQLSYSSIQSVEITEKGINYAVSIMSDTDTIHLLAPKKEVSAFMGANRPPIFRIRME